MKAQEASAHIIGPNDLFKMLSQDGYESLNNPDDTKGPMIIGKLNGIFVIYVPTHDSETLTIYKSEQQMAIERGEKPFEAPIVYVPCIPVACDPDGHITWCYPGNAPEGKDQDEWNEEKRSLFYETVDRSFWNENKAIDIDREGRVIDLTDRVKANWSVRQTFGAEPVIQEKC